MMRYVGKRLEEIEGNRHFLVVASYLALLLTLLLDQYKVTLKENEM